MDNNSNISEGSNSSNKDSYAEAMTIGYGGMAEGWLECLKDGKKRNHCHNSFDPVLSYDAAIANGFTGTQEQWVKNFGFNS